MKKITFTVHGQKLQGNLFYPEKVKPKNPAILLLHGWKSSQKRHIERAEHLVALGFICMTFDLRSHGVSEGDRSKLSIENYLTDVLAAYDFLKTQKYVNADHIGVIGSSFGGYLGSLLTSKRSVKWLALQAPANYPDEGFEDPKPDDPAPIFPWRAEPKSYMEVQSLNAIHEYPNEILIVESEYDEFVPKQTIENYKNTIKNKDKLTYVFLKGADHSVREGDSSEQYLQILTDWFKDKALVVKTVVFRVFFRWLSVGRLV